MSSSGDKQPPKRNDKKQRSNVDEQEKDEAELMEMVIEKRRTISQQQSFGRAPLSESSYASSIASTPSRPGAYHQQPLRHTQSEPIDTTASTGSTATRHRSSDNSRRSSARNVQQQREREEDEAEVMEMILEKRRMVTQGGSIVSGSVRGGSVGATQVERDIRAKERLRQQQQQQPKNRRGADPPAHNARQQRERSREQMDDDAELMEMVLEKRRAISQHPNISSTSSVLARTSSTFREEAEAISSIPLRATSSSSVENDTTNDDAEVNDADIVDLILQKRAISGHYRASSSTFAGEYNNNYRDEEDAADAAIPTVGIAMTLSSFQDNAGELPWGTRRTGNDLIQDTDSGTDENESQYSGGNRTSAASTNSRSSSSHRSASSSVRRASRRPRSRPGAVSVAGISAIEREAARTSASSSSQAWMTPGGADSSDLAMDLALDLAMRRRSTSALDALNPDDPEVQQLQLQQQPHQRQAATTPNALLLEQALDALNPDDPELHQLQEQVQQHQQAAMASNALLLEQELVAMANTGTPLAGGHDDEETAEGTSPNAVRSGGGGLATFVQNSTRSIKSGGGGTVGDESNKDDSKNEDRAKVDPDLEHMLAPDDAMILAVAQPVLDDGSDDDDDETSKDGSEYYTDEESGDYDGEEGDERRRRRRRNTTVQPATYAVEYDPDAKPAIDAALYYKTKRFRLYASMAFLVTAVLIICAAVGVTVMKPSPTAVDTEDDSAIPSSTTASTGPTAYREFLGIQDVIMDAIDNGKMKLRDPDSPYSKALRWILHDDPMTLLPNATHLIQRYTAAYLYFATTVDGSWKSCNPPNRTTYDGDNNVGSTSSSLLSLCTWMRLEDVELGFYTEIASTAWLTNTSECAWAGVTCDERNQIRFLDLRGMNMSGSFPEGIMNLPFLQTIVFVAGNLRGTLPSDLLEKMPSLNQIEIVQQRLTGSIPEQWWEARNLFRLTVRDNDLTGTIPSQVGLLNDMKVLDLAKNSFSGTIPTEIGMLQSLTKLDLSENKLKGKIPETVGEWKWMDTLWLSRNQLTGNIPSSVGRLTNLKELKLDYNQELSGEIPDTLFDLSLMEVIHFGDCSFFGTLSPKFGNFGANLRQLRLRNNRFYGTVPLEFSELITLAVVDLEGNSLTGSVPEEFCTPHLGLKDGGEKLSFSADCAPDDTTGQIELTCTCCTDCCQPGGTDCLPTSSGV